jgi:hypothetical protein
MQKLNRNYLSFFEFLGFNKPNKDQPVGYSFHGHRYLDGSGENPVVLIEGDRIIPRDVIHPRFQFLGALTPLAKMVKDIYDTTQPYATRRKFFMDLAQPSRGIGNILKGVAIILGGAVLTTLMLLGMPFLFWLPSYRARIVYPVSWVLEGVSNTIYGAVQLIATPLLLFKIPLRVGLTLAFKGEKLAEEKPEIQRLAREAEALLKSLEDSEEPMTLKPSVKTTKNKEEIGRKVASLLFEVERKYQKSVNNGWKSNKSDVKTKFDIIYPFFQRVAQGVTQINVDKAYAKDAPEVKKWANQFNNEALKATHNNEDNTFVLKGLVNDPAPDIGQDEKTLALEYLNLFKC